MCVWILPDSVPIRGHWIPAPLKRVRLIPRLADAPPRRLGSPYAHMAVGLRLPAGTGADTLLRATGMRPTHLATRLRLLAAEREHAQEIAGRKLLVRTGPGSVGRDTGVVVRELSDSGYEERPGPRPHGEDRRRSVGRARGPDTGSAGLGRYDRG
jgi:hypothetical protein